MAMSLSATCATPPGVAKSPGVAATNGASAAASSPAAAVGVEVAEVGVGGGSTPLYTASPEHVQPQASASAAVPHGIWFFE